MVDKDKVLAGRKAVDAYRADHATLEIYAGGWYKGMSEDHTPFLDTMLAEFKKQGFNSLQEFFDASELFNAQEAGLFDGGIRQNREDLAILGLSLNTSYGVVAEDNGVVLEFGENRGEKEATLYIDGYTLMNTTPDKHISMSRAVDNCPSNSNVFIGGLGLALVVLYLAQSGKSIEVVVSEIDERVTRLLASRISQWFATNYPDFNLTIVLEDAYAGISKHGLFDWVYIDLSKGAPPEFEALAKAVLTPRGVYTPFQPFNEGWR